MSDTPWVDALRAAHATRAPGGLLKGVKPLSVREYYGAVLLDEYGPDIEDLLQGSTVISHDDATVTGCVMEALRRILPEGLLIIGFGHHDAGYDAAVNKGVPVVIVTWDRDGVTPAEAVELADRDYVLGEGCDHGIVSELIHAVTGVWQPIATADAQYLTPDTLLRCVHLGSEAADCACRIETIVRRAKGARDEEGRKAVSTDPVGDMVRDAAAKRDAAKTDAVPVAAAAAEVVRKLSDMKGFGQAGVWGCNLAVDVRAYSRGALSWRDVPRGILLSGPPGGGKTTFAKALALECEVDLVPTTYTDWSAAGGGIGDSMSKGMTKLFDTWRAKAKAAPFILFLDEIDTIGARGQNGNNESWFTAIINGWLAFLDGAVPRDGIVVVAATNWPDRVDPGLRRPGRLDRHVELPMPDVAVLASMVRSHLGDDLVVLGGDDLARAARAVRGRSPAEVAMLCREARRVARWAGRKVCADDLVEVVGAERVGQDPQTMRRIAVHEAGHAVAGVLLEGDVLESVDLDAGHAAYRKRSIDTRAVVEARMTMLLAARAAEQVVLGDVSTGSGQDLADATNLAGNMRGSWGMGDIGLMALPPEAAVHDHRHQMWVRKTIDDAYARATELVTGARDAVERVAEALLRDRYLEGDEVRALVAGPLPAAAQAPATPPARTRVMRAPWLGRT